MKFVTVFKHLALAGALVASANFAHASSFEYYLTGVTTSAGTLTGDVFINSANDEITSANITFNDSAVGDPVFDVINYNSPYNGLDQADITAGVSNPPINYGGQLLLYFDTTGIGTSNLGICISGGTCGTSPGGNGTTTAQAYVSNNNGGPFDVTAGSLTLTAPSSAVAPEPSSLVLLGTGILGFAGLARRKFLKV